MTSWYVFTSDDHLRTIDEYAEIFNEECSYVETKQFYLNDEEYDNKPRAAATSSQGNALFAYGFGRLDTGAVKE